MNCPRIVIEIAMLSPKRLLLFFVIVGLGTACLFGDDKFPIPASAEQQRKIDLVWDVFGKEFKGATTVEKKDALAKTLQEEAKKTKGDPTEKYALLRVAMEVAIQAGNVEMALGILNDIRNQFDLDFPKAQALVLQQLCKTVRPDDRVGLVNRIGNEVRERIRRNEFATALSLAETVLPVARTTRNPQLVRNVTEGIKNLQKLSRQYAEVETAKDTLTNAPIVANGIVGRHLCFVNHDWDRGLSMLAISGDETLKGIAGKDLANPTSPEDRLAVADAWLALADREDIIADSAHVEDALKARARHWYEMIVQSTAGGLIRAKAVKQLATISGADLTSIHPKLGYPLKTHPPDAMFFNGHWYKRIQGCPTWKEAHNACRELGGYLICIESKEEAKLLKKFHHSWIGAVRRNGRWGWINGNEITFTSWRHGYPNAKRTREVFTYTDPHGNWVTSPGTEKPAQIYGFVCEWEQ